MWLIYWFVFLKIKINYQIYRFLKWGVKKDDNEPYLYIKAPKLPWSPPPFCLLTHSPLSSSCLSSVCLASDKPLERCLVETASTNSLCYQANRILFLQPMLKMASLDMRRKRWVIWGREDRNFKGGGGHLAPPLTSSHPPPCPSHPLPFLSYSMKISSLFLGMGSNGAFRWGNSFRILAFSRGVWANELVSQATSVFMNT